MGDPFVSDSSGGFNACALRATLSGDKNVLTNKIELGGTVYSSRDNERVVGARRAQVTRKLRRKVVELCSGARVAQGVRNRRRKLTYSRERRKANLHADFGHEGQVGRQTYTLISAMGAGSEGKLAR